MAGPKQFDVVVVGAGGTGLLAAITVARTGLRTALCGQIATDLPDHAKSRTAALLSPTIAMLDTAGLWETLLEHATPIEAIRIIDDMQRWPRAPEVLFSARELGLEALGWNVANADITAGLAKTLLSEAQCEIVSSGQVVDIALDNEFTVLRLDDSTELHARFVIGADGRNSVCRRAAGVEVSRQSLDQIGITCVFGHSRAHDNVSTEFHRPVGPFTTVPLSGNKSSLVWVESAGIARQLEDQLRGNELERQIEARLFGLLGSVTSTAGLQMFPLSHLSTGKLADRRIALVGEAAHVFPPIGAQGLNLGFRDVAALVAIVKTYASDPTELGSEHMLTRYNRARRADVQSRALGVSLLNNMLTSPKWPVHLVRGAGLHALNNLPGLKRQIMRLGMGGRG